MKYVMKRSAAVLMLAGLMIWMPLNAAEPAAGEAIAEEQAAEEPAVEPQATEEGVSEREAWAKSLFEGRCQMCHQLPEPGMLTPKQWKLILFVMQQRMQQAGVPPLTDDETERLLEYLTPRAR